MDAEGRAIGWGFSPNRPFRVLVLYFAVATLQLALVAARPPLPDTRTSLLWALAAVGAALGVATAVAWSVSGLRALPVLAMLGAVHTAGGAYAAAGGQGQLVSAFYLTALGVYAGYFLSRRVVRVFLVVAVVSFGAALLANRLLDTPAYLIGVLVAVVGVTLIVSSLVQQLRAQAVQDPLTGLLNRRGLQDSAALLHALDARRSTTTTVVEIDLDGFKSYNDTHGHDAGDRLLESVARDWSRALRRTDVLARTGGDEFVLVLPATTRPEAEVLVSRLRQANDAAWSAGIVEWLPGEPLPVALRHADQEMYRHKPSPRSDPP
jgi:diguanylate cyclase (GGDEF)-like protein